jgi:ABC-type sugar transport system ATPase subunit
MVGERLAQEAVTQTRAVRRPRGTGKVRLRASGLTRRGLFHDVSFDLHEGEILCLTGLIGSKRTDLLRCLFGADGLDDGTLELDGVPVRFASPRQAMAAGIGFVPEDRHRDGLMLGMSLAENVSMTLLDRLRTGPLLRRRRMASNALRTIADLSIHPSDPVRMMSAFSGGNQQKSLIGKWLNRAPRVLVLDEPTVGVDVGAKAEIYAILRRERDRGAAVLAVSSDLEEVATISDRIGVMVQGRLVAIHDAGSVPMARITAEIGGGAP